MELYFAIIVLLAFFSIGKIKGIKENSELFVVMCLLWIMASIRSVTVGNDTAEYYRLFKSVCNGAGFEVYQGRYEIGYYYLNEIIGHITNDFNIFLFIINAFTYYAYYLFIKKYSSNYILSVLLFLCLGYWGQTVNVIRLQFAIAACIYAYILINENKRIKGIITGVSSVLFQRISFANLLVLLVPKRINKKFYFIASLGTIIVYVFFGRLISLVVQYVPYYGRYIQDSSIYIVGTTSLAILLKMLLSFLIWIIAISIYNKNKCSIEEEKQIIIESQINLLYISFLMLFIATKFNLIDRCEIFFGLFTILLIPNLLNIIKNKGNRKILGFVFIVIGVLYFIVVNIYRPEWNHIYPYHTFWYDTRDC